MLSGQALRIIRYISNNPPTIQRRFYSADVVYSKLHRKRRNIPRDVYDGILITLAESRYIAFEDNQRTIFSRLDSTSNYRNIIWKSAIQFVICSLLIPIIVAFITAYLTAK